MASLKTIAATAVIAVGGTVAAFTGLHLGQPPAGAADAARPARHASTVTLTAGDLAKLASMIDSRRPPATVRATAHHKSPSHHKQTATRHRTHHATTLAGYRTPHAAATVSTAHHGAAHGGTGCYDDGSGHHGEGGGCD